MTAGLIGGRRASELLWSNLRLVVLDIETLWETGSSLPADADAETQAAIEQVRSTGVPVRLRPQVRRVRYFEHQAIEAAGLTSASLGSEPDRAVEVRPGSGVAKPASDPQAVTHEGRHRVISLAAVELVRGRIARTPFFRLVNPGVPVDPATFEVHHIETRHLAGAPDFGRVAPELLDRLLARDGETVILVAHNASFDLGVLRTEFELIGHVFPNLPVLDTRGPIVRHVGVAPRDGSLNALLAALHITNAAPHTATGAAVATATAAIELLRLASERGIAYAPTLLEAAGSRHAGDMKAPGRIRPSQRAVAAMPPEHLDTHHLLPERPTKAERTAWIRMADDCAQRRCPDLGLAYDSLVRASPADPDMLLDALTAALAMRAAAGDGPGVNTVLGAIAAVFLRFCPMPMPSGFTGNYPVRRKAAIGIYHRAMAAADGLAPCRGFAACPACHVGRPCPRVELLRAIAPAVLDPRWEDGKLTRGSTFMAWWRYDEAGGWFFHGSEGGSSRGGVRAGRVLADATLAIMFRGYLAYGEEADRASRVRDELARAMAFGCEDPALVEMWADRLATGGRIEDIRDAHAACDARLATRPDPSDSAWASLAVTRDQFAARLTRMVERKRIDKDGNVEQMRWRHPGPRARRVRPMRFVRP